jgi:hypothetical protein
MHAALLNQRDISLPLFLFCASSAAAATQVGKPTDRDWSVFCSSCHHLASDAAQQQHSHGPPSLRHKRAKALRERSVAMRVAADAAVDDMACLAQLFVGNVTVPGFGCTLHVRQTILRSFTHVCGYS